jgi:hypothetical protein
MSTATIEVTLPPAKAQMVPQAHRVITISGSLADGSQNVAVTFNGPVTVKVAMGAKALISLQEVLANGKTHPAVTYDISPDGHIEPVPPDATGFSAKVISVE